MFKDQSQEIYRYEISLLKPPGDMDYNSETPE